MNLSKIKMIITVLLVSAFAFGTTFIAGGLKCAIYTILSAVFLYCFGTLIAWLFD